MSDKEFDRYFIEYNMVGRWIGNLVNHPDYYITNDGYVIRYRESTGDTYLRTMRPKPHVSTPYYVVNIVDQTTKRNKMYYNHILVYKAWVGDYDRHTHNLWFIDGDIRNCHVDNLELITHSEKGKRIDYMKRGIDWNAIVDEFGALA
jgi:hypothetical protein|nr:MAG TPA: PROTEIN/DNA Complex catalytic motif, Helix-turn-helix DNA [Caudoviricetes sp.]